MVKIPIITIYPLKEILSRNFPKERVLNTFFSYLAQPPMWLLLSMIPP